MMGKIKHLLKFTLLSVFMFMSFSAPVLAAPQTPCDGGTFLGFPTWYKYLDGDHYKELSTNQDVCNPKMNGLNDIWKIVAAVIEILLRVAGIVAIAMIVWGGISYTISQGNGDKTKDALKTIINSLIGLVIAIGATGIVNFVAGRF